MRATRSSRREPSTNIGFNATPMIDVIFMLTIFFMLVSTFLEREHVPLELPEPVKSQAKDVKLAEREVINCQLHPDSDEFAPIVMYRLGPNNPEPLDVIAQRLAAKKNAAPDLKIIIRADRRLPYRDVRAIMQVVAQQNIEMVNVAATTGQGEQ